MVKWWPVVFSSVTFPCSTTWGSRNCRYYRDGCRKYLYQGTKKENEFSLPPPTILDNYNEKSRGHSDNCKSFREATVTLHISDQRRNQRTGFHTAFSLCKHALAGTSVRLFYREHRPKEAEPDSSSSAGRHPLPPKCPLQVRVRISIESFCPSPSCEEESSKKNISVTGWSKGAPSTPFVNGLTVHMRV